MGWTGNVACILNIRIAYNYLVGKLEMRNPYMRVGRTSVNDIKTNLNKVGCQSMCWIELTQGWNNLV
jgi:hypothetical protein